MYREDIIPHEEYEIAARYAKALHQIAREKGGTYQIYQIESELRIFLHILEKQKNLNKILNHPVIGLGQKEVLLNGVFTRGWISAEAKNFVRLLIEKKRLPILRYILDVYREITFILEQKVKVYASSGSKLSGQMAEILKGHLCREIGKDVDLDVTIDKSLIGGLIVMVGDRLYDGSVRKRLKLLREELA